MSRDTEGLSAADVRTRIERGDVNNEITPTSRSAISIIRANVVTRFNALLGTLFIVILVVGPWQDALFGGVLIVNTLIGIVQEFRAKRLLDRLMLTTQPHVHAVRAGQVTAIPARDIVLDDIIELSAGDQIVVDGVMLTSQGLEVDESLLTGESEPVIKEPGAEMLSGSLVVAGSGRCRATRVGAAAYAHRYASAARHFHLAHSELRDGIDRILRYVTWAIVPTAALLFASQIATKAPLGTVLLFSAAGVVAMVPEGLVLLTSLALAIGAVRLARQRTLVQDLPAIETLARIDVICLDKTGTLTERELRVERVELLAGADGEHPDTLRALGAIAVADPHPNATLQAIVQAYAQDERPRIIAFMPFSSGRKWSGATLEGLGTWILGAPDVMLAAPGHQAVRRRSEELARSGQRVLLLAHTASTGEAERLPGDLVPAALVVLAERVRDDVAGAVQFCREQGLAIKVLSGDHPDTVGRIASITGIPHDAPVDARTLPDNPLALAELAERHAVFGRISPQQKQSVIASLQANGHVVAMIGDGVNDILALKKADVGVAMGAGADAARAVSHLVLLDNRFGTLPAVVAEGRRVIGNVERVAALFLTKTVYAMLLAFIVGIAGVMFPFLPRHLTLVGALTIGIPAFLLSLEPNAQRARAGFVVRVLGFAVPAGLFVAAATFAAYVTVHAYVGASVNAARTAAAVTLFLTASWVLVLVAQPLTTVRRLLVASMALLFSLIFALSETRTFFVLEHLTLHAWLAVTGIAGVAGAVMHWSSAVAASRPSEILKNRPWKAKDVLSWLLAADSPKWFVLTAAVFVVGGAWLFFGVLEDVVSHDPLVEVDVLVYQLLQAARTPTMDNMMVAITELGDVQVLLPVIVVVLVWFVARRLWLSAGYWLIAVGVAELLTKILKLVLHRPRPGARYLGIEAFSFPSGHATMSVVVYGFLALLLCRHLHAGQRTRIAMVAMTLVTLIAISRLYLGAHWLSDVLGGIAFGTAWIALLAIAYAYQSTEDIRPKPLTALVAALLCVAGSIHFAFHHANDVAFYAGAATSLR